MSSKMKDVGAGDAVPGEALASLAAFQELILERTHELITIIDPTGTIVYGSPSWQLIGWDPDQLAGRQALDLVHPADQEIGVRAIEELLEGKSVAGVTVRLQSKDGGWTWYESTASPIA